MIKRFASAGVFVTDQNEALQFYTEKVGFVVRADVTVGDGYRWLTVGPKDQPEFQFILSALKPGGYLTEDGVEMLKQLLQSGQLGGGVWETDDCQQTYETMQANGVEFLRPPTDMPYGLEAVWRDNSGNWFTLLQRDSSPA